MARSKDWDGLAFRVLAEPGREARELFAFVGAWAPSPADVVTGWGAWDGETLVGAVLLERAGGAAMLHGPVISAPPGADPDPALDAAAGLVALALASTESAKNHKFPPMIPSLNPKRRSITNSPPIVGRTQTLRPNRSSRN